MFGASDVIEGVGDFTSAITGQGLDQRRYNPIRDEVLQGNELLYSGAEILVSAGTSAAVSKALTSTAGATTQSLRATAERGLAREAEVAGSGAKVMGESGAVAREAEELGAARCIGAKPYSGVRNPSVDFAGKSGVGKETLTGHLKAHGKDFGFTTEEEYLQGARRFFEKPLTPTTEAFISNQGWYFRYDKATNEFGLINDKGGISTYYKPKEGYAYWLGETEKYITKK